MSFLLDTNVISEMRKGQRANPGVRRWAASTEPRVQFTSVLVLGEMRYGTELKRRHDPRQADILEAWLQKSIRAFHGRILPVDDRIADAWGRLGIPDPIPDIDGLLAATALVHGLTLVTRDTALLSIDAIRAVNPFATP